MRYPILILSIFIGAFVCFLIYYNEKSKKHTANVYYRKGLWNNLNAQTIPPIGIFIDEKHMDNEMLLAHEQIHWKQYQEEGLLNFIAGYLLESVKNGYDGNKYEIEARNNETEYCKENYTECVRSGQSITVHNPCFRK